MSIVIQDQAKIHRWVLWLIVRKLVKQLGIKKYAIAGSYRRGKWWCNDIDLLIPVGASTETNGLSELMLKLGWLKRAERNEGGDVFSLQYIKKIGSKVLVLDLFLVPPGCWGNAMLFATGPKSFNDTIRGEIVSVGYSWANPRYFTHIRSSKELSFSEEKSALRFLGLKWIPPNKRV